MTICCSLQVLWTVYSNLQAQFPLKLKLKLKLKLLFWASTPTKLPWGWNVRGWSAGEMSRGWSVRGVKSRGGELSGGELSGGEVSRGWNCGGEVSGGELPGVKGRWTTGYSTFDKYSTWLADIRYGFSISDSRVELKEMKKGLFWAPHSHAGNRKSRLRFFSSSIGHDSNKIKTIRFNVS